MLKTLIEQYKKMNNERKIRKTLAKKLSGKNIQKKSESIINQAESTSDLSFNDVKDKILKGQYKVFKKSGKSKVWDLYLGIFNEKGVEIESVVACKKCNKILKVNRKSTSNLMKHKCYVISVYKESNNPPANVSNETETSDLSNNGVVKDKILNGQYKVFNKSGKSRAWDLFLGISDHNGVEIKNSVTCKKCNSIFKFSDKSTSNLMKHKCYLLSLCKESYHPEVQVDTQTKNKGVCVITEWAVANCRSFKIFEDSGLKKFASFLIAVGAKYGENVKLESLLPHPTILSRNVEKLYNKYFDEIKMELSAIETNGYGVTAGMWTDNYFQMSYLAVIIHYIKNGELKNKLLALRSTEGERSTVSGENINFIVLQTLADFNCELRKAIVVTDSGANMISAFRSYDQIFCINHLLNNALEKCIKETPEIAELCNACTKLVEYLKKSGINLKLQSNLENVCSTRRKTILYLLTSVENNWSEITSILRENSEMQIINNINSNLVAAVLKVLVSFEETSKKLESENIPTLHWVYIWIHQLKKMCAITQDEDNIVRHFKQKLSDTLNDVVLKNMKIYHKIALFLFGPANKLNQFTESEKNVIKAECKKLMKTYTENISGENNDMPSTSKMSLSNSDLLSDFVQVSALYNSDDTIENEIRIYENTHVQFYDDFNILEWWNLHKAQFPILYRVSCKILATPASSAASERIFSMARNLISEKISSISTNSVTINQIMFLHSNIEDATICSEIEGLIDQV